MNPNTNPAGQEMIFDKYVAIALIVGIIAGFIIGNSVGQSKSEETKNGTSTASRLVFGEKGTTTVNSTPSNTNIAANTTSNAPLTAGEWLEVNDQKAGRAVTVSNLVLDKPYWVAIQDSRTTNKRFYILGAKKFQAGTHTNQAIQLTRPTQAGRSYDLVFYEDKGNFSYDSSLIVMDGNQPVGVTFKAN